MLFVFLCTLDNQYVYFLYLFLHRCQHCWSACVFFLCLYNHFLPQKFVLQCSHWNLLIPSQLGGGTETSESVGEESDSIVA